MGPNSASVLLIQYSDFQCPACKFYQPILAELNRVYPLQLTIVYRHFPLKTIHLQATLAAQAAEAAGLQQKFWPMHDLLFERQADWAEKRQAKTLFLDYAQSLNLNLDQFQRDLVSREIQTLVQADYVSGLRYRLNSTPAFFLNGNRIQPPADLSAFLELLKPLIAATPSATPSANI